MNDIVVCVLKYASVSDAVDWLILYYILWASFIYLCMSLQAICRIQDTVVQRIYIEYELY